MPFAERLLAGVDAGLAGGGETRPIMAAALLIRTGRCRRAAVVDAV